MARRNKEVQHVSWLDLEGKIALEVFSAPKTGSDSYSEWPPVHERIVQCLLRRVVGTPWANHLALMAAVLSARRLDVQSVCLTIQHLHSRFSAIFTAVGIKTMGEWKNELHLPPYFKGEIAPEDSQNTRQQFLLKYTSGTRHIQNWLDSLPASERQRYQQFTLPEVGSFLYEQLDKWKEISQQQREHRKAETEAIVPHFAELRAESHFRYNRLTRLWHAYLQASSQILPDHSNLLLEFSYEEGNPPLERFHFRLWDRRSFILDPEQETAYAPRTQKKPERKTSLE